MYNVRHSPFPVATCIAACICTFVCALIIVHEHRQSKGSVGQLVVIRFVCFGAEERGRDNSEAAKTVLSIARACTDPSKTLQDDRTKNSDRQTRPRYSVRSRGRTKKGMCVATGDPEENGTPRDPQILQAHPFQGLKDTTRGTSATCTQHGKQEWRRRSSLYMVSE